MVAIAAGKSQRKSENDLELERALRADRRRVPEVVDAWECWEGTDPELAAFITAMLLPTPGRSDLEWARLKRLVAEVIERRAPERMGSFRWKVMDDWFEAVAAEDRLLGLRMVLELRLLWKATDENEAARARALVDSWTSFEEVESEVVKELVGALLAESHARVVGHAVGRLAPERLAGLEGSTRSGEWHSDEWVKALVAEVPLLALQVGMEVALKRELTEYGSWAALVVMQWWRFGRFGLGPRRKTSVEVGECAWDPPGRSFRELAERVG